ncbi:MAG: iron-sulfur cluster repair di-iron protein [Telmatospirillum sp.]|nr:iron-sulfur cluster repair di-iron protein [Telmatospirillum sp.]
MSASAISISSLGPRTLGDIAARIPGSTAIFRRHGLDFCCGGFETLEGAVLRLGLDRNSIAAEIAALAGAEREPPADPDGLIDHILDRFHAVHRRDFPELILLARKVAKVHASHPELPGGIVETLEEMSEALESHMRKEEQVLFPMMRRGGHPMIRQPIAVMYDEHVEHGARLSALSAATDGFCAPDDACGSWRALYAGLEKLAVDLTDHIHTENNILFPLFAR